jgi:polyisoprenoid-binding protein YceI
MRKTLILSLIAALTIVACKSEVDNKPAATVTEPAVAEKPAEPAAEKPAEPVAEKPAEPAAADPNAVPAADVALTEIAVAPESVIGWVGAKVTGDHKGDFKTFTGKLFVTPDNKLAKVTFEVDTTSVTSDNEKLTGHLKSPDFFDVAQFPKASFETTEIKDGSTVSGYTHTITGKFTIRGVTKDIAFPATFTVEGEGVQAKSEFTIKRKDFGIVYEGKADDLIKDEVLLKLDLKGKIEKKS